MITKTRILLFVVYINNQEIKHAICGMESSAIREQEVPYICDWDNDGDWDLLVGGGYGYQRWRVS